jgi:hypothetical protein
MYNVIINVFSTAPEIRTYKLHYGHVRMVQITQRRFPMINNIIFGLFPKIDFD